MRTEHVQTASGIPTNVGIHPRTEHVQTASGIPTNVGIHPRTEHVQTASVIPTNVGIYVRTEQLRQPIAVVPTSTRDSRWSKVGISLILCGEIPTSVGMTE